MKPSTQTAIAIVGVAVLFAALTATILEVPSFNQEGAGSEDMEQIVESLFRTNVLSFEILGILLTAAMIGAMVIARPLGKPMDEERYAKKSDEELEATQRVSEFEVE